MKKLFLFLSLISFFLITGFSQFSYSIIQETVQYDEKYSAISVVHSSGYIYHFQSSNNSIFVSKVNAQTFATMGVDYRLDNQNANYTINGGFEDPEGNIIIYGSNMTNGFIYKIQIPSLSILNVAYIPNNKIMSGCWGEKNSNGTSYNRAYAFITYLGEIMLANSTLGFNTNKYLINNGHATHITWDILNKKFICSGYKVSRTNRVNPDPFLIKCDFKDTYTSGWFVYNKFFLREGNYMKGVYGKITHSVMSDGRVLIAQTIKTSGVPWIILSIHTLSSITPYNSSVDAISKVNFNSGEIKNLDMLNLPSVNAINLLSMYKDINNISKNMISTITVNQNNILIYNYLVNTDYVSLSQIFFNGFDELRPLNIFTGLFKSFDGVNRTGAILSNHQSFNTSCDQSLTGTPYMSTDYEISSLIDSFSLMPTYSNLNIPIFNIVNTHGIKGICGEYHSGLPAKENEKSILITQETTITLFESQEFLLQGFKGSVFCNIYDMTGKMVYSVTSENDMNNSIPTLSKGIYILKAVDNYGNSKTTKFFKD